MLARAGARCGRVAESDGATGQAGTGPRDFGPRRSLHAYWRGDRDATDFRTIDERGRRCLREPAHGVREWPRAMARRGRLLPDLSISAHTPQHVPDACSHRMQLSSLHPDEAPGQTVRRTSKAGFRRLHVHAEHVPHAMQCKHRTVRVHLEQRFSTLGIEGRGDPWRGASEYGTSDECSRRLSDTLTAIPGAC